MDEEEQGGACWTGCCLAWAVFLGLLGYVGIVVIISQF